MCLWQKIYIFVAITNFAGNLVLAIVFDANAVKY